MLEASALCHYSNNNNYTAFFLKSIDVRSMVLVIRVLVWLWVHVALVDMAAVCVLN